MQPHERFLVSGFINVENAMNANYQNTNTAPTMNAKELRCKALHLLSRREHTRQEINSKLKTKAEDPAALNDVLDALESERLQSDERFAESYIRMRVNRGYGPSRIKQELREKGVSAEEIKLALDASGYDWGELASVARTKKFGSQKPREASDRSKQMRFLLYRGFNNEQIKVALIKN
jgi:regulatory protein